MSTFGHFTVARTSVKRVLNASGVLAEVAANTPALEFNTDGTYRGLLVEPAATNLQTYSQDFRNIAEGGATNTWSPNDTLILSTNNTAPDGTLTATRIRGNGANRARQASITGTSGAPYTASFFIRSVSGTGTLSIRVGDVGQTATVNPTTTWQRFSHTASPTTTTVRIAVVFTNDTDEFEIWGAQLETGSVATSYIPTVASTQTRTADNVTLTGASSLIGQTEGTLYAEVQITAFGNAGVFFSISDGTTNNRAQIYKFTDSKIYSDRISATQSALTSISTSALTPGIYKVAFAYKTGDSALFINGVQVGSTATQTFTFGTIGKINIGARFDDTQIFNDRIRSVALFPSRLSNAQLATLTT